MAFDYNELKNFSKKLGSAENLDKLKESCVKELAARLLRKVVKRTPTGIYQSESGKTGGNLKQKWTTSTVKHGNGQTTIDVLNPVEYASYVEYGHRQEPGRFVPVLGKRLKASWVHGKFMLTKSEDELRQTAQGIVDAKTQKYMEELINGK